MHRDFSPLRGSRMRAAGSLAIAMLLVSCGGGGGGGSTTPVVMTTPTPTPTPTPAGSVPASAFTCPTSDGTSAVARTGSTGEALTRMKPRHSTNRQTVSGLLAVTYDRSAANATTPAVAAREQNLGATLVQSLDFPHTGVVTRVLSVPAAKAAAVQATLRSQAGVRSVSMTAVRRASKVTVPFFPNDPYFNGFTAAQNGIAANAGAPATNADPPYFEVANVPGQWDMHAIGLEYAFGYSQATNGSTMTNAAAFGSASIKIAVIDTGADTLHPELAGKVAIQRCFITNLSGVQSKSNFVTDPDGHGTNTSGIAAENTNNAFGFTGSGGLVSLVEYRVFPTPDDTCVGNSGDASCDSGTNDIASAILDAIAQHVNVISMSLGGDGCTNGQDSDMTEGTAVAEAIAAGITVVAAAGNDGTTGSAAALEAPACDPGVIAAGASALGDGSPNGTNANGSPGSAGNPLEYVASYSNVGSPAANLHSASAWGIVAPGGDPAGNGDNDDLHWIENIWTSTPFMSSGSDISFAGNCAADYAHLGGIDCRTLIAGTSMSTPHVAGAAALILSVSPGMTPVQVKALLCSTADDIHDPHEGCGRLNIYRAMATVLNDPVLP